VRGVHILGVGATSFSGAERTERTLVRAAVSSALVDAGVGASDVDAVVLAAPGGVAPVLDVLEASRRAGPPVCVSGAAALHVAWQDVANGGHDVVLCVAHGSGGDAAGAAVETLAAEARHYMAASGATEQHFARVAAKNRAHGVHNPRALLTAAVGQDAVLASEVVVWPLRRLMLAQRSEGAAAVVFGSAETRRRTGAVGPRVLASVLVRDAADGMLAASARAARLAYQVAGLGPEDLDCAELDDRSAAREIAAYEALQLAPEGRGPELVESGFTTRGGVLPVNTSGGALSQGDADGAFGVAQVCELAWQLRGEAERRQVAGAHAGLALAGEHEADGRALASLTILGNG
jgi:acetyl-CoA acetyltransferase